MPETSYKLTGHLYCADGRLNTWIETRVLLDHYPTEKEAIHFLCIQAEEVVARNFCEGCPYELVSVGIEAAEVP
jgi:hypothetical protein